MGFKKQYHLVERLKRAPSFNDFTPAPSPEDNQLKAQIAGLKSEMALKEKLYAQMIETLKKEHQTSLQTIQSQANFWRASNEDEFCRLVTSFTKQLTTLQNKYDKALKEKAYLAQQLKSCQQED